MKFIVTSMFVLAVAGLLFISCKNRDSSDPSAAKKILAGKWKIVKITTEEDYAEATGTADDNGVIVTFNANGTGNSASVSGGSTFKWELANNSTYLNITDSATVQTVSLLLTKTSESSFTVKDTSAHPAQWEVFKKQ